MTVDFTEMNPQVPSPLNSGRSGGIAAARVAFKALTSPDLDVNEGCFRPLDVILPEGTMLSAKPPARARPLEHRAADGDRHDPQGAVAGGAASHSGRAQGRHGRLLVLRLPAGRQPVPADEHIRRRLGRAAGRGRRVGQRLGVPRRRAQHAGRIAGDQISGAGRAPRVAQRQRRRRPLPRRSRPRSRPTACCSPARPTSIASAHVDPPWGLHRRQVRGHQCRDHPPRRRRRRKKLSTRRPRSRSALATA